MASAFDAQQRTQLMPVAKGHDRRHARQPRGPRAAQQRQQHDFELIIGVRGPVTSSSPGLSAPASAARRASRAAPPPSPSASLTCTRSTESGTRHCLAVRWQKRRNSTAAGCRWPWSTYTARSARADPDSSLARTADAAARWNPRHRTSATAHFSLVGSRDSALAPTSTASGVSLRQGSGGARRAPAGQAFALREYAEGGQLLRAIGEQLGHRHLLEDGEMAEDRRLQAKPRSPPWSRCAPPSGSCTTSSTSAAPWRAIGRQAHGIGCGFSCRRSSTGWKRSFGRDHRVHRVLQHQQPVVHADGQRAAGNHPRRSRR